MSSVLIEKSVRQTLRYLVNGKLISTEDLWHINNLTLLDETYRALNKQLREQTEESLLESKSDVVTLLELKRDVVRYIVETLKSEQQLREQQKKQAVDNTALKQQLLAALHEQDSAAIKSLSRDEIIKRLEELG